MCPGHRPDSQRWWFQARTRDLFASAANANGDLYKVLSKIQSYSLDATIRGAAETGSPGSDGIVWGQAQYVVRFNAFATAFRANLNSGAVCGQARIGLANALHHEGRHAYQAYLTSQQSNDEDKDWAVDLIPIAPASIIEDSTRMRTVCDPNHDASPGVIGTLMPNWQFNGPTVFDPYYAPSPGQGMSWVWWALEMDAYTFAASPPR